LTLAANENGYDCATTLAKINAELPADKRQRPQLHHTPTQYLNLAKKTLTAARLEATRIRKIFLEERRGRIATRKTSPLLSPEAALKCIPKQLRQANKFGNIAHAIKPNTNAPLTKVHITTTTSTTDPETAASTVQVIDTRAKREARILARNKIHFAQAMGDSIHTRSSPAHHS
jgi:uncharacterized protein (UPF0371 family)